MPNYIQNEIVFGNISFFQKRKLLKKIAKNSKIDFKILVPVPLNIWWGNTGKIHEETFKESRLDWARLNWGTKWNAIESTIISKRKKLILQFRTAWSPPYGWVVAVFNYSRLPFSLLWLDEGYDKGHFEIYKKYEEPLDEEWQRVEITEEQQKHIYELLRGKEEDA